MTELLEVYKCNICGNIVCILHKGAGKLVCCNEKMKLQKENTVDASFEKHIPVLEKTENGVLVKIGEKEHPMIEEHYIEWIEVITKDNSYIHFLKPNDKPEFMFYTSHDIIATRAYCNIHGLWKK